MVVGVVEGPITARLARLLEGRPGGRALEKAGQTGRAHCGFRWYLVCIAFGDTGWGGGRRRRRPDYR